MELLDTSSEYCEILVKDNKKYVIKHPRQYDVMQEYYRSTPESEVIELLQSHNIRVPKLLYKNNRYSVQEYINGTLLSDLYDDHKDIDRDIINQIIEEIYSITKIDGKKLLKYTRVV